MNQRLFLTAVVVLGGVIVGYYVGTNRQPRSQTESDCSPQTVHGFEPGIGSFKVGPSYIIVAKNDIPEGKLLEQTDLRSRCIPLQFIEPYATQDTQEVVGLVTRVPIASGQQVLQTSLRQPSKDPLLSENGK